MHPRLSPRYPTGCKNRMTKSTADCRLGHGCHAGQAGLQATCHDPQTQDTHRLVLAIVLLLIAGRIAMPYVVEDFANDKLAALDSYRGHVGDIDIHLWRGAYSIDNIEIIKIGAARPSIRSDTLTHYHRHRVREGRRRPHPRGGGGDRRPRRGQRGLQRHRADRPHLAGAGQQPRRRGQGRGRRDQQGPGRDGDRDPHRLPHLLPARPGIRASLGLD